MVCEEADAGHGGAVERMGTTGPERTHDLRSLQAAVEAIVSPAYLVGGSVRDLLMGRACEDYDFAVSATPDEVETAVRAAGRRPYLTGKRFGTVGFRVEGRMVEVTTFRAEAYDGASRRPEVRYLDDFGEDLARRDFTINAIALHGGTVIDPHGGRADIGARLVRAVGDAAERFDEDPLRMLRAARFASQLDFTVDAGTVAGMRAGAARILSVACERRANEFDKLLSGQAPAAALDLLADTGLLRYLVPELHLLRTTRPTAWAEALGAVAAAPCDAAARWAALLRDVALPYLAGAGGDAQAAGTLGAEIADRIGLGLRWSRAQRATVREGVRDAIR